MEISPCIPVFPNLSYFWQVSSFFRAHHVILPPLAGSVEQKRFLSTSEAMMAQKLRDNFGNLGCCRRLKAGPPLQFAKIPLGRAVEADYFTYTRKERKSFGTETIFA
jgi:hypothetical protein